MDVSICSGRGIGDNWQVGVKGSGKCLLNHSLVVEVKRKEDGFGDVKAHEVEGSHIS